MDKIYRYIIVLFSVLFIECNHNADNIDDREDIKTEIKFNEDKTEKYHYNYWLDGKLKSKMFFKHDKPQVTYIYHRNGTILQYVYYNDSEPIFATNYDSLGNCISQEGSLLIEILLDASNIQHKVAVGENLHLQFVVPYPMKCNTNVNNLFIIEVDDRFEPYFLDSLKSYLRNKSEKNFQISGIKYFEKLKKYKKNPYDNMGSKFEGKFISVYEIVLYDSTVLQTFKDTIYFDFEAALPETQIKKTNKN